MIDIIDEKCLVMKNVLSCRIKGSQNDFIKKMLEMEEILKENSVVKDGSIATAIHSVDLIGNEQVIDMEVKIPLDKEIEPPSGYDFLAEFRIERAIYTRCVGNPQDIPKVIQQFGDYIQENSLTPITPPYNVTIKEAKASSEMDDMIIDIYIGVAV